MNILALGVLATGALLAQRGPHTPPDAASMASRHVERLTSALTLTAAQQTQATTIFTNAFNAEANLRTNLQTAHTSLRTAVQKNDTASIDNLSSQIGALSGQELNIQSKAEAAFYATLTADQQTKYASQHTRGGPGGPGGGPAAMMHGGPRQ